MLEFLVLLRWVQHARSFITTASYKLQLRIAISVRAEGFRWTCNFAITAYDGGRLHAARGTDNDKMVALPQVMEPHYRKVSVNLLLMLRIPQQLFALANKQ